MQTTTEANIEEALAKFEASAESKNKRTEILRDEFAKGIAQAGPAMERVKQFLPKDYLIPGFQSIKFDGVQFDDREHKVYASYSDGEGRAIEVPVHNHALRQLAEQAKIPGPYITTMIKDGQTELIANNLNDRLDATESNDYYVARVANGHLMGWVSNKFDLHDTHQIIEAFLTFCRQRGLRPIEVKHFETRIVIRMLSDQIYEPFPGEAIIPGILFQTGDFGGVAFKIVEEWMRPWCLNGCVTNYGFRRPHKAAELDPTIFSRETIDKQTQFLVSALKDTLGSTFEPRNILTRVQGLKQAHEAHVDIEATLDAMTNKSRITKVEKERIQEILKVDDPNLLPPVRSLPQSGHTSLARLSNAFSLFAQDAEKEGVRACELREIAGSLMFPKEKKAA